MLGLMAACPCMLFIDIISLFINLANKDACFSPDPVADFGEGATGGEKGK